MQLQVENIHTFYGRSHILFDVSLAVDKGESVCLLGRNGAGKSTTFRSIMGLTPPKSGIIRFKSETISGVRSYLIARKGVGYVPSGGRLFGDLTVDENLTVAKKSADSNHTLQKWTLENIYDLFPVLKKYAKKPSKKLSGGEQQMITIARALMGNPELLILDEPSTGLAPLVVKDVGERILKLRDEGLSILLAEQNVKFGISLCERSYVIDKGEIQFQGTCQELEENEEIVNTYLAV